MAPKGGQPNNKNAALKPERRPRVNVTLTLSGELLLKYARYIQEVTGDNEYVTDEQIISGARQEFYDWLEKLVQP